MPPGACGVWSGPAAVPPPPVRLPSPLPRQQPAAAPPVGVWEWGVGSSDEAANAPLDRSKKFTWCAALLIGRNRQSSMQPQQHTLARKGTACATARQRQREELQATCRMHSAQMAYLEGYCDAEELLCA